MIFDYQIIGSQYISNDGIVANSFYKLNREYRDIANKEIVKSGIFSYYLKFRRYCYLKQQIEYNRGVTEQMLNTFAELGQYSDFMELYSYNPNIIDYCQKLYDAHKHKRRRLKLNKLAPMFEKYKCSFLTLTFTDEVLANTSAETRRTYIARCLKALKVPYVANIDFGDKEKNPDSKEREHYHAVVGTIDIPKDFYPYGIFNIKKIRADENSQVRISKYIDKFTNHAHKESTHLTQRLIFSRK